MTSFTQKQLKSANRVCVRLKEAREAAGFSIEDIVKKTKIRPNYIKALESCQFDELPKGIVYRKQIIKSYTQTIGVKPDSYIFQYTSEETKEGNKMHIIPTRPNRSYFQNIPAMVRFACLLFVGLTSATYLGLQIHKIIQPPTLALHSPENGVITYDSAIDVYGETGNEVFVSINGKEIINNGSGQFTERIDLTQGVNTIVVSAKRRHGKSTTVTRHVIQKENNQLSLER